MAKMIGNMRDQGCGFGKSCTCNGMYRTKQYTRIAKRRERQQWRKDLRSEQ